MENGGGDKLVPVQWNPSEDIFLVVESFLDLTLSCRLTAIFDQLSFVHSLYQHGKIFWPYKKNNAVIKHDRAEV